MYLSSIHLKCSACNLYLKDYTFLFNRMDSTLVDFSDMKWQRGDLTFIFNGDVKGMTVYSIALLAI